MNGLEMVLWIALLFVVAPRILRWGYRPVAGLRVGCPDEDAAGQLERN